MDYNVYRTVYSILVFAMTATILIFYFYGLAATQTP